MMAMNGVGWRCSFPPGWRSCGTGAGMAARCTASLLVRQAEQRDLARTRAQVAQKFSSSSAG